MLLRRLLVEIRKDYNTNFKNALIRLLIGFGVVVLIGLALDIFLPFSGLWNVLRSIVLIPTAFIVFYLGYFLSLWAHDQRRRDNKDWTPLRSRFSPRWRNRFSIILGAVLVVIVYALGFQPGYTLWASCVVSVVIGLFAFCRLNAEELNRRDLGIPDPRDYEYDQEVARRKAKFEAREEAKSKTKKLRKEQALKGRKAARELEEELNNE